MRNRMWEGERALSGSPLTCCSRCRYELLRFNSVGQNGGRVPTVSRERPVLDPSGTRCVNAVVLWMTAHRKKQELARPSRRYLFTLAACSQRNKSICDRRYQTNQCHRCQRPDKMRLG
ncbi:hypothetical protein EYF80_029763 [Liparis tanakae]|uniref:Uncharacterized protein n=1 Tax=Liparis tanakae TaxID=230148 RepID=A0A4Z2H3Y4_9TELE|nr:hypothetical protein EYF80_029763 [Liparis tanakae]